MAVLNWNSGARTILFPAGPGSFFWDYPGLRLDWRPGLRPGLFSFAPSGLGVGGGCLSYGGVWGNSYSAWWECLDAVLSM
jgi:hypothetical protein